MNKDYFRMGQWLLLGAVFYGLTQIPDLSPVFQTVSMKLGNVTIGAFLGYWVDRISSRLRIKEYSANEEHLRRAIIMAAAMICVSLGL